MNIKKKFERFGNKLINDDYRKLFTLILMSGLSCIVLLVGGLVSFHDQDSLKGIIFSAMAGLSFLICLLSHLFNRYHRVYRYVYILSFVALFTYHLLIGGEEDSLLLYWILLLPAFSFISFGLLEGLVSSGSMFIIVLVVFWTPLSDLALVYETPLAIKLRFSILFLICFVFGIACEAIRYVTASRLKKANEQLEFASLHDSLTNAANQNYLAKYLDTIFQNKSQEGYFGCLFIDVDGFKEVNDSYGHLFGNIVLVRIAETLMSEKSAFVCRWGGDEFVVCFNGVEKEELMKIADEYRVKIAKEAFEEHPDFHITISVGVTLLEVDETFNFNKVLEMTDVEMRHAKEQGKNKISFTENKKRPL